MSRKAIIITAAVILTLLASGGFIRYAALDPAEEDGPFITANPLELSQIKAISQYRSCEGHNYSGKNAQGIEETYRTMKHYIEPIQQLAQSTGRVKVFAPFDGTVSGITGEKRGANVHLSPQANNWNFIYFHVDLLPQLNDGAKITAGQHIGYADLAGGANFDIAMRWFGFGPQRNDSPFLYLTESVQAEYAAAGIAPENIIISKEERDARPCQLAPGQSGRDAIYAQNESGKSWIPLKHQ